MLAAIRRASSRVSSFAAVVLERQLPGAPSSSPPIRPMLAAIPRASSRVSSFAAAPSLACCLAQAGCGRLERVADVRPDVGATPARAGVLAVPEGRRDEPSDLRPKKKRTGTRSHAGPISFASIVSR